MSGPFAGRSPIYVGAWAGRPSASTVPAGSTLTITEALAPGGQVVHQWYSTGTHWKPLHPILAASKFGITDGVAQTAIQFIGGVGPFLAGALELSNGTFKYSVGRNNTTEALGSSTELRVGPQVPVAGSAVGTVVSSATISGLLSGTNISAGFDTAMRWSAASTILKPGTANASSSYSGALASGAALDASAANANFDTSQALYVTINTTMPGVATIPRTGQMEYWLFPGA